MRPLATGRSAVRAIVRSMSRSIAWLIAPAPPAERAPPRQVRKTSPSEGSPATYIVVTVVKSSSDCTFGLVSVTKSRRSEGAAGRRGMAAVWAPLMAAQATGCDSRGRPLGAGAAVGDRLADVAHRPGAAHVGQQVEVVRLRRREREPLERVAAPGVVPGRGAALAAEDRVDQGHQDPGGEDEGADRGDQVVGVDAGPVEELVGVDHLALLAAGEEERHEGDERSPAAIVQKEKRGQGLAHRAAGHLREPPVQRREAAEDGAADEREVGRRGAVGRVLQAPAERHHRVR